MRLRWPGVLAAVLATACFDENVPVNTTPGTDGTVSDTGTAGTGPGATETGFVTDTEPPLPTTTEMPSTSVDDTATTADESTTGEPIPIECGDGMTAPGELCYDDTTLLMANDSTFSARIGDVSGSSAADLVHLIYDQAVVRVGDGGGNFGAAIFDASVVAERFELADIDGDGELDMVVAETDGQLSVLHGSGSGSFSQGDQVPTGNDPLALAVGQLEDDADLDVMVGSGTSLYTALGNGSGDVSAGPMSTTIGNVMGIALADFDGDGTTDVALTVDGAGWQGVALQRGTGGGGTFQEQETTPGQLPGARGLAVGDFDGNGTVDVAYASQPSDVIGVLLGTGDGGFQDQLAAPTGSGPTVVHADDLDGDGRDEILVAHQGESTVRIFRVTARGPMEALQIPLAAAATSLDTGDVNGDGVPDIAATSTGAEIVTVLLSTP
jgi:hypothetical protein